MGKFPVKKSPVDSATFVIGKAAFRKIAPATPILLDIGIH
jgi:hypothetical protein